MEFLADAHVSAEMVAMLRELGHECSDGASIPPRMPDVEVIRLASAEGRIIITSDKDFGEFVFVHAIPSPGVILLRIALADEADRVAVLKRFLPQILSRLPGSLLTVSASGVGVRPIH